MFRDTGRHVFVMSREDGRGPRSGEHGGRSGARGIVKKAAAVLEKKYSA